MAENLWLHGCLPCNIKRVFMCILPYYREIIETMVQAYGQKVFAGQKPVFDGRKNLYSRDPLPIGREKVIGATFKQDKIHGICTPGWENLATNVRLFLCVYVVKFLLDKPTFCE